MSQTFFLSSANMLVECFGFKKKSCANVLLRAAAYRAWQRGNRLRESLPTFITLHKARAVYHWEVVADTKLFQDSSLGNSVCTSRCRTK